MGIWNLVSKDFNLLALENTHDWRNFLTRTQSNCEDQLKWVLVIEREQEELSMLVKLKPEVELINGMRFPVNDPRIIDRETHAVD